MSRLTRISASYSKLRQILPVVALMILCVVPALAKKQGSGDFNGDGFADLCIGVPSYTIGTEGAAGAVNCLYGSTGGLQASGVPLGAQLWTQDTDGVQGVSEAGDQFGFALAFGDFNGDGYDDLCIGVPYEHVSGVTNAGSVNCIYGSPSGLQSTGTQGPLPQLWGPSTLGVPLQANANFGFSLIAGDFNHDGFDDLCIGIPYLNVGGTTEAGEVVCLYGSGGGLQKGGAQTWNLETAGVGGGLTEDAQFGWALAAGDFNHDGFDDLCVSADSALVHNDQGLVDCIYGSSGLGLQTKGNGGPASQYWYPALGSLKGGTGGGSDQFGFSLTVGDFNHDGYADLAIGSTYSGGTSGGGKVNVLYGSQTGLQATGSGAPDDQLWTRSSASVKGSNVYTFEFGYALVAGDFNHDGYDDLCIGVPYDSTIAQNGGSVNCLYGSVTGLQSTGTGAPDDQLWDQNSDGVKGTTEAFDSFGIAMAAGDFNSDGFIDLAIGVPGENSNAGGINVLYGYIFGLQSGGAPGFPDDQFWRQGSDGVPGSGGGGFGGSLSH